MASLTSAELRPEMWDNIPNSIWSSIWPLIALSEEGKFAGLWPEARDLRWRKKNEENYGRLTYSQAKELSQNPKPLDKAKMACVRR
jgi:hypothetical protein